MNNHIPFLLKPNVRWAVLLLTVLTAVFWILVSVIDDVYKIAWVGAIFELLWLFSLILVLVLPVVAILGWIKEKFNYKSVYLVSILIIALTILFLSLSGSK